MVDFDDGKDSQALRTIGEVAKALAIKPHVLRYWEQQFDALQPLKRSGGRRYYRPEDVALVERIDALVNRQGYTLKGAEAALKEASSHEAEQEAAAANDTPAAEAGTQVRGTAPILARLKDIRAELADAIAG